MIIENDKKKVEIEKVSSVNTWIDNIHLIFDFRNCHARIIKLSFSYVEKGTF